MDVKPLQPRNAEPPILVTELPMVIVDKDEHPEKAFEGTVSSIDKIDINGQGITLEVTQDTSDLNIKNGDAAIVVLLKK